MCFGKGFGNDVFGVVEFYFVVVYGGEVVEMYIVLVDVVFDFVCVWELVFVGEWYLVFGKFDLVFFNVLCVKDIFEEVVLVC